MSLIRGSQFSGSSASGGGNFTTTSSFNNFTSSYYQDSSSFDHRISNITASGGVSTSSFNTYTASVAVQLTLLFSSQSYYTPTSSFNALSSSYSIDSASFNGRINTVSTSLVNTIGGYQTTASFNIYSSSVGIQLSIFSILSSSYVVDSSSFNTRIASITGSTPTNTGSLLLTSSFNSFSGSYVVDSSSFNSRINSITSPVDTGSFLLTSSFNAYTASANNQYLNIFISQSNYLPTSSFNAFSASYHIDSGSFLTLISNITSSGGAINTGSLLLTSSFNIYTASVSSSLNAGTGLSGSPFNSTKPVTFTSNISTGVPGGQTAIGGTGSAESLTFTSTNHATKGKIYFGSTQSSFYDEANAYMKLVNNNVSGTSPTTGLYIQNVATASSTTQQSSGVLVFESQGYKTTAPSGSQPTNIRLYSLPVINASNPDPSLHIDTSVSSSAPVNFLTMTLNAGVTPVMTFNGAFQIANVSGIHIQAGSGNRTLLPQSSVQISAGTLSIGSTFTAQAMWLNIAASTATKSHINLSSGSIPTTPSDGDFYYTGSGDLYFQAKGVTYRLTNLGNVSGSVPAMTFIGSGSVSSSATCDINLSSSFNLYSSIQIDFMNLIPQTSGTSLLLRVSSDGINYDTGSTAYTWFWGNNAGFTQSTGSDSKATLVAGGGLANGAGQATDGTLKLYHPNQSGSQPQIRGDMILAGTTVADVDFAITRLANQFTKGIRFLCGSGNISMIWKAYGYN